MIILNERILLVDHRVTLMVAFAFLSQNFWEGGGDLQMILRHSVNVG